MDLCIHRKFGAGTKLWIISTEVWRLSRPERSIAGAKRGRSSVRPLGGPIYNGLKMLHQSHVLGSPPAGSALDDAAFEPGVLYENNQLLVDLLKGLED